MILLHTLLARYKAAQLFRKTRAELSRLDDRMLADIGFSRSEIDRVSAQAAGI